MILRVKKQSASLGKKPRIVFPEGRSSKVLKAINYLAGDGFFEPILIGYESVVKEQIETLGLTALKDVPIIHPSQHKDYKRYSEAFYKKRMRKGILATEAERRMADPYYFASQMVAMGDADGLVTGAQQNYADAVKPILQTIGTGKSKTCSGLNMIVTKEGLMFLADTTINIDPSAEQLANIAFHASNIAKYFGYEPRIAMLSFTNFTSSQETPRKMKKAAELVKSRHPELIVEGEMQADTAINPSIAERIFPFSELKAGANILIFPNLDSGNIAYKMVQQMGDVEVLGPFLLGIQKPANVLQRTCNVDDIVNTIALTALETQAYETEVQN